MSRVVKVPTYELGDLDLLVLYRVQGVFEKDWSGIQGQEEVLSLVTIVSQQVWDDALVGLTYPLVKALSLPPKGCLKKLPLKAKVCAKKEGCVFFDKKNCYPESKTLPWCFEPCGLDPKVTDLIAAWREGKYVVVVDYAHEV